jgi:hypothetical protein
MDEMCGCGHPMEIHDCTGCLGYVVDREICPCEVEPHDLQLGVIEVNGECIVAIKCEKCDLLATGAGVVSDLGGGYTVIDSHQ